MKPASTPLADFSEKNVQIFLILLSWVIYISVLIYLPTHLKDAELLGLAAIPVMTSGWVLGTRKGIATALGTTLLHVILSISLEFNSIYWPAFALQHGIGLAILSLASTFVGYLRDLNEEKHHEINAWKIARSKISRYGRLLKLINQSTTQLLSIPQWENRVADFVAQLGEATQAGHVYLCEIPSKASDSFLLYLRHHWYATQNGTIKKTRLEKFASANSGIGSWVANAEEEGSFSGQISALPKTDSTFLSSIDSGTFLVFPIFTKGELWGFLGLETFHDDPAWEEFEIDAINTLAKTLGSTIHHRELEETLNIRAREIQTLHRASQQASSATDQFSSSIEAILEQVLTIGPAQEAMLYLYSNYKLTLGGHLQAPGHNFPQPPPAKGNELAYTAARKNETITISNLRYHPLFQKVEACWANSVAAIPIRIASEVIGVMVTWYATERAFPEEELQVMRLFSAQLATVIRNTQQFKAEQEQRKLAEALRLANLKLTTSLELTSVLESILEQTLKLVSAQNAYIFLYNGETIELGAAKWTDSDKYEAPISPREDGLTYKVARSGERILVSDMRSHELFQNAPPEWEGAIIGLPLKFRNKVIGVMNVAFNVPRPFTENVLRIFDLLSDQAAIAINNARTFEEEREQRKFTEALQTTGKIISSTLDLDTVFDHILIQLEQVVPYDTANLMLAKEGKAYIVRKQGYDQLDAAPRVDDLVLKIKDFSSFRQMVDTQQPVIITNTKTDPRWVVTESTGYVQSWAGAPILDDKKITGFLSLNKVDPNYYQPKHGPRIAAFASQAAIAVKNARLFESVQTHARELKALHDATSSLVATLNIEELLQRILLAAIKAIPAAEKGSLMLKDSDTGELKIRASEGYANHHIRSFSLPISNGYASHTLREKQPKLFNNIQATEGIRVKSDDVSDINTIQSAICVPLISEDIPLGVLSLDSTHNNAFTETDLELLSSFAATATSAIINAQLHTKVQKLAITDSLTQTLNRRGLDQWGKYELERSKRFGRPLASIFFDLDYFKQVNDTYGHDIGDRVLAEVSQRCQQNIRQVDILGRYGGEEFVILLPETSQTEAFTLAERVRKAIASTPFRIESLEIDISISLGVAVIDTEIQTLSDLVKAADHAMYKSKQNGRNQTSKYSREVKSNE